MGFVGFGVWVVVVFGGLLCLFVLRGGDGVKGRRWILRGGGRRWGKGEEVDIEGMGVEMGYNGTGDKRTGYKMTRVKRTGDKEWGKF